MRILFCNKYSYRFSGTEAYLFDLMNLLREDGHSVALFSVKDERGESSPYERFFVRKLDFKNPGPNPGRRLRMATHAVYSCEARRKIAALIHEFRPDVAHVRNIYHHISPSILWELKKQRVPVIYHLNDFKLLCPNYNFVARGALCERCAHGGFKNAVLSGCYEGGRAAGAVLAFEAYFHRWLKTYESCVDCFLVPSAFVREKLMEHGWAGHRIEVLPHFQRVAREEQVAPKPQGPVLYFGRLSPEKGLLDLLEAAKQVRHIPIVLAGDGPQRAELEQRCRQERLTQVQFAGHLGQAELDRLVASCAFTVFPSRAYETLGKSILESYAWSRPVVATDLGSRAEFVKDGRTGFLYPPGDSGRLAELLSMLYGKPHLVAEMGRAGREMLARNHSPERHRTALTTLYGDLAQRSKRLLSRQGRRPLRIAFIGGRGLVSKYSGIEAYYEEVGMRLADRGHQVTVYCRSHFTPKLAMRHGMRIVRIPTVRFKHLETLVHTMASTLHALGKRYDVVHFHALGSALFSSLPRLVGSKTAVTVQGLDWQRKKWGRIAASVLRLGERAAAHLPDSTMVVSRTLHRYFQKQFGIHAAYIPNGASLRPQRAPKFLRGWDLQSENYVLFLGRFSPEKNCHLLVRAFEGLRTSAKLVLAGNFSYADDYAQNLLGHASEQVRFFPYMEGEALDELLTHCAVFILPSDLEGLSLALLEAMGAGRCVLTSDIPENRELAEGVGFTFRAGDVEDLQRMLALLLADPDLRRRSGLQARARIRAEYDWDRIAGAIEAEYYRIADIPVMNPESRRPPAKAEHRERTTGSRIAS